MAVLDTATLAPPLIVRVALGGASIKTPAGVNVDVTDLPVLWDANGPVGPPLFESQRAMPTRRTTDLLLVAFDPGVDPRSSTRPTCAAALRTGLRASWARGRSGDSPDPAHEPAALSSLSPHVAIVETDYY